MDARAFVIAIEDYSNGNFLPNLPGTNKDAEVFIQWLRDRKGVKPGDILCCADSGVKSRTTGTTSSEIIAELGKAVANWADKTDEFYFYFSGHGFSYSTSAFERSVDVLVGSEIADLATGGRACLPLNEIKTKLWKSLGPRHHYYFIDACRNQIQADAISPAGTGLGFPTSQLGTPTIYKMFSTAQGAVSKTQSGFTPLLVEGLSGAGRAKGLRASRMYVIFELLCEYMKKNLQPSGQDVDYDREGSGEGFLLELKPIPKTRCEIKVANAKPGDQFSLTVRDIKGFENRQQFKGGSFEFSLFPDDYSFELKHPSADIVRKPPPDDPVDLYDPSIVHFELRKPSTTQKKATKVAAGPKSTGSVFGITAGPTGSGSKESKSKGSRGRAAILKFNPQWIADPPPPFFKNLDSAAIRELTAAKGDFGAKVNRIINTTFESLSAPETTPKTANLKLLSAPTPHTEIEVLSLKTGQVLRSKGDFDKEVPPGDYVVKLRERGVTVSQHEIAVKPGEKKTLKLLSRPKDKVRESILKTVKAIDIEGASVFSETSLGPLANHDLGLWLSLFGASRILGKPGQFRKLERLPLETFEDIKKNGTTVYVLAGFEKSDGPFGIGLSAGAEVDWKLLKEVKGLHKIYERRLPASAGSHLLSLKIPKRSPVTFAIHCLPNRATLVTFAQDKDGRLTFHQSLLPILHLSKYLDPTVRSYLRGNMLSVVRTMTLAQSQFARKRSVQEQLKSTDVKVWNDLVNHKWLDPLMALIAAYDVIRHGTVQQARTLLKVVNSNLRKYFEGIGDIEAISKLLGRQWRIPTAPPLLLDGVLAFDEIQEKQMLPLTPDRLDYGSTWTAWQGAVNDFDLTAESSRRRRTRIASTKSVKRSPRTATKSKRTTAKRSRKIATNRRRTSASRKNTR